MKSLINQKINSGSDLDGQFKSVQAIYLIDKKSMAKRWIFGFSVLLAMTMFLPWTQNIRTRGQVTTLRQEDRPQELNTMIPGRIEKWYVKEGDFVSKGDTILRLTEVKTEYLDPQLSGRTKTQIDAKAQSIGAYESKAEAAQNQIVALQEAKTLKLSSLDNKIEQQYLKISSDSASLAAAENALLAYSRQIEAAKVMLDSGAISMVNFEKRRVAYQEGKAKVQSYQNKLDQSRQELLNLRIEKNSTVQEYNEKISKASSDRFGSLSSAASTAADVAKLENQLANYDARKGFYYLLAPQSGQVTKAKKAGIGEILKEGEMIVQIVPDQREMAVELYVKPMDLPLVNPGQKVRFLFDGYPAIVFSGWPNTSYGTFGGKVIAVESSVSTNGLFRVLAVPDVDEKNWPDNLRVGGGAQGIALLSDVPIYYELWRNINGFPPEYYLPETEKSKSK
ncbi:MAG: HlyD family secretion protein [Cytophagales bacterium]|nr:HlyD family secretion protein [Cytophagales bacterium]